MTKALDANTVATRSVVEFCALEAGYSVLEINKFTTAPAHYSAERYSTGVLRALTNMQQATDNAIRRTVVSGVMIGVLTVAQAAERVGVTEDAVRSWGILPEWEREPIDAGCENDDEADQRLAA